MFKVQFQAEHEEMVRRIAGDALVEIRMGKNVGPEWTCHIATVDGGDDLKAKFKTTGLDGRGIAVVSMKGFAPDEPHVTVTFPTVELADAFKMWMCDAGGEQNFWDCCENQGIEAIGFDYHDPGGCEIRGYRHEDDAT